MNGEYLSYLNLLKQIRLHRGGSSFEECWNNAPRRLPITTEPLKEIWSGKGPDGREFETVYDATGLDPQSIHMCPELARRLSRYVKWHWEWSGLAAEEVWPFGDLKSPTLYRTLAGQRDNWSSEFAARLLTFIARCTQRFPSEVWRDAVQSPTQRILEQYDGEGGSIRRQFPVYHSGRKLSYFQKLWTAATS